MANTKDLQPDLMRLRTLLYGPSGVGKTFNIKSYPKPYVFDTDLGMLTLAGADVEYDSYIDVDVRKPTAWKAITAKVDEFIAMGAESPFRTYAFDSLSTLQDRLMTQVQATNGRAGQPATQQEYGIMIDKMEEFFHTKLMALSAFANVLVIGHEQIFQDGVTGEIFVTPLVIGKKLPHKLPMFFDEVYRLSADRDAKGNRVWRVMTSADRRYQAKSRIPGVRAAKEVVLEEGEGLYTKIMELARAEA